MPLRVLHSSGDLIKDVPVCAKCQRERETQLYTNIFKLTNFSSPLEIPILPSKNRAYLVSQAILFSRASKKTSVREGAREGEGECGKERMVRTCASANKIQNDVHHIHQIRCMCFLCCNNACEFLVHQFEDRSYCLLLSHRFFLVI